MIKIWNKKAIMLAIGFMLLISTFGTSVNMVTAQEDRELGNGSQEDKESVLINADEEVIYHELTVNIDGDGTVTVEWDDEEEEVDEDQTFVIENGTEVALTADPVDDWDPEPIEFSLRVWRFKGWTGDYEGENREITLTMDSDIETTAVFEKEEVDFIEEIRNIPGFTTVLLIFGMVVAVAIYYKKEQ